MLKRLIVSAALIAGTSTLAFADTSLLAGRSVASAAQPMAHHHMRHRHVLANGRCNGISYGTGQGSCGTATGGTPGGNPNRN